MSISPQQALHVGDNLADDVHGALGAGLQAAYLVRDADRAAHHRTAVAGARYLVVTSLTELADAIV